MRQTISLVAAVLATATVPANAISPAAPVGPPFQVNTHTLDRQSSPNIAADASGNFIVVWISRNQDGSWTGVFGQRYDDTGTALGSEFQVNTYTFDIQGVEPIGVSAAADGDFVIAWSSHLQDGSSAGIFAQRYDNFGALIFVRQFDSSGDAVGAEFEVNTFTGAIGRRAVVSGRSAEDFVVAWDEGARYPDVFARRFVIAATPTASPLATTPVATPGVCPGDCGGDGHVTVDDLVRVITIALGQAVPSSCDRADVNGDGLITVDELVEVVNAVLNGCVT